MIRRLRSDQKGAALTEFGLIIPVLATLLLGAMDVGHTLYMRAVLDGSLQKAARDSGLETGTLEERQSVIDGVVRAQLNSLGVNNDHIIFKRRYYRSFTEASAAAGEPFTDTNKNGKCDAGEPYEDHNNNKVHDPDGADGGQGGAKDTVILTVHADYPRMFPMAGLIGLPKNVSMEASTVMNNQPYGEQGSHGSPTVRHCS